VELIARDRVRPAVDDVDERVLLPRVEARRRITYACTGVATRALELHLLDFAERDVRDERLGEARERRGRLAVRRRGPQLCRLGQRLAA